jgi:hypothetical protein
LLVKKAVSDSRGHLKLKIPKYGIFIDSGNARVEKYQKNRVLGQLDEGVFLEEEVEADTLSYSRRASD